MHTFFNKNNKGLTLVETLVAISVLLMAVVGPMVIYSKSITNVRDTGDRFVAYYLAQEAIELMKFKVYTEFNENTANGTDFWFDSLPNCDFGNGGDKCTVDIPNGDVCNGGSCDSRLYLDSNNLYNHDNDGTPTKFSRTVKFENLPPEEGALVSTTVTWESSVGSKSVTVEEYMTKWR